MLSHKQNKKTVDWSQSAKSQRYFYTHFQKGKAYRAAKPKILEQFRVGPYVVLKGRKLQCSALEAKKASVSK